MDRYAIGVDLGGTNIKFGIVSEKGKIKDKISLKTFAEEGPEKVIAQIKSGIKEILSENKYKINGIGIGSPGVVSSDKGIVENPPNLPGWTKINLGKVIQKEFNLDVYVENDANAAAIGEMIFGAGKKYSSFIMVTLGTGVGGGVIINKKIYKGEFGAAGELGHLTIDYNGPRCNCGSYGCIEAYIGNNYLVHWVKDELKQNQSSKVLKLINNNYDMLTPKIIQDAAEEGDHFAQSVIEKMGKYLGAAFASVSNLLDISTFIVGGGVAGFGKPLFDSIDTAATERVLTPLRNRVEVLPAKLKNDAGIKGASALVFYEP
jgi:glucokinase